MKSAALAACAALLAGCAQPHLVADHPLAGQFWDARSGSFVSAEDVWRRAAAVRHVLIGEVHDNTSHHRAQLEALRALAAAGSVRALAMEQFDSEHQGGIDAARTRGADAETLAEAGRFDRAGWNWPLYEPLVRFAVERGWPLIAANFSRAELRRTRAEPASGLPPPAPGLEAALEREMIEGHCGHRPDAGTLAFMVRAQRARDARMAEVMTRAAALPTVLIAGNAHVRRDRGVPIHLDATQVLAVGQIEVQPDVVDVHAYFSGDFFTRTSYDYVHFTPRQIREDPCRGFKIR